MKILLVEDNLINQKLMVRLLQKRSHQVMSAGNGKEALDILDKHEFDLIFMDIQMPEMDGLQATAAIRNREGDSRNRIPIVALTAHNQIGDQDRFLRQGFDGYLAKPIQYEQVYGILEKFWSSSRPESLGDHEDSPDISVWNKPEFMARVAHDQQLLREVIEYFLQDYPNKLNALKQGFASGQGKDFQAAAHGLKGAAANISAKAMVNICQNLEKIGQENNFKEAETALSDLEQAFEKLKQEFYRQDVISR